MDHVHKAVFKRGLSGLKTKFGSSQGWEKLKFMSNQVLWKAFSHDESSIFDVAHLSCVAFCWCEDWSSIMYYRSNSVWIDSMVGWRNSYGFMFLCADSFKLRSFCQQYGFTGEMALLSRCEKWQGWIMQMTVCPQNSGEFINIHGQTEGVIVTGDVWGIGQDACSWTLPRRISHVTGLARCKPLSCCVWHSHSDLPFDDNWSRSRGMTGVSHDVLKERVNDTKLTNFSMSFF